MPTLIDVRQINQGQLEDFILGVVGVSNNNIETLFGSASIPELVDTHNITFTEPFASAPKIFGNLSNASNSDILGFQIREITPSGFSLVFSSETPDSSFVFEYMAVLGDGKYNILTKV